MEETSPEKGDRWQGRGDFGPNRQGAENTTGHQGREGAGTGLTETDGRAPGETVGETSLPTRVPNRRPGLFSFEGHEGATKV